MRALLLPLSLAVLTCLAARPARALVCPQGCEAIECGFSFAKALDCSALPTNHALEMTVTCADEIPREAFPRLIDADGHELPQTWEMARDITDKGSPSRVVVYRLDAPGLPAEQRFTLQGPVPLACQAEASFTCSKENGVFCPAEEGPSGCCSVFERAGLRFEAYRIPSEESPQEIDSLPEEEEPTDSDGGGGAGGASNEAPSPITYLTFFTRAPDESPPPALRVVPLCLRYADPRFSIFSLSYTVDGPLDDVVQVEIFGRRVSSSKDADSEPSADSSPDAEPYELVEHFTATPCVAEEERAFASSLEPDAWGIVCPGPRGNREETWRFFARSTDNAGHRTDGPEVTFDSLEDCRQGTQRTSAPTHVCPPAPGAPTDCTPQEFDDEQLPPSPGWHSCLAPSSEDLNPPVAAEGLCRPMTSEEQEAPWRDGDADERAQEQPKQDSGCACATPGAPGRVRLELFAGGALLGLGWMLRRRRSQERGFARR